MSKVNVTAKMKKMDKVEYKEITKEFVKLLNDDPVLASSVELGIYDNNIADFEPVTEETIETLKLVQEDIRHALDIESQIAALDRLLEGNEFRNVKKDTYLMGKLYSIKVDLLRLKDSYCHILNSRHIVDMKEFEK